MTVKLSAGSPRLGAARRFGIELDKALRTRGVGAKRVAGQIGMASSLLAMYRAGQNLPRLETAARLADALDWPSLVTIARAGRSLACARCGARFLNQGGNAKRFCSPECRAIDEQLRKPAAGSVLANEIGALIAAGGHLRRADVDAALARYRAGESRRIRRVDQQAQAITTLRDAIAGYCAACEPEGVCRTADCPLRSVSPLVSAEFAEIPGGTVRKAPGTHAPEHRDRWLAAHRRAQAVRWERPGERERMGELHRARHASLTDEQRQARRDAISQGRRRRYEEKAS